MIVSKSDYISYSLAAVDCRESEDKWRAFLSHPVCVEMDNRGKDGYKVIETDNDLQVLSNGGVLILQQDGYNISVMSQSTADEVKVAVDNKHAEYLARKMKKHQIMLKQRNAKTE